MPQTRLCSAAEDQKRVVMQIQWCRSMRKTRRADAQPLALVRFRRIVARRLHPARQLEDRQPIDGTRS